MCQFDICFLKMRFFSLQNDFTSPLNNSFDNAVLFSVQQPENVNSMPLLQSIYQLSKACQMEMISASKFLEEGEQQQVECLIASANRIVEHLSIKKALPVSALLKTPKPNTCILNNSKSSDRSLRDVYPEKFNLFSSTQCALPCSPREDHNSLPAYPTIPSFSPSGIPTDMPTAVNDVAPLPTENNISTSTKHVNQVNLAESILPNSDFAFFQSGNEAASVASPARCKPVCSSQIPKIADACKNYLSEEGAPASPSSPAVTHILQSSSSTVADYFNPAAPIVKLTPVNSASFTGRPARLKITKSPLLSTGTASTIKFPRVSVPESDDGSILLRGVVRQLTLRPTSVSAEACRPGSPLQQTTCKEDGISTLSQLHSCVHGQVKESDLKTSSLIPETLKGFDARTGSLSNYSDYPRSSAQNHKNTVKLGDNQRESPTVSAVGSPVSVEMVAEDGERIVGDLKSSRTQQKEVIGGLSPPYHIRTEEGARSSKEAVARDEIFIQKDIAGVTKGLLLSSNTTNQFTQPDVVVVLPSQLIPSHSVSQIHAYSESAANSDFTFGVASGLKAGIPLSLCPKPGEKSYGLQDFNSGRNEPLPHNSSLGVPLAGVEKRTEKQGTPAPIHTSSEDSPQELQDVYEVAFEKQLGLPQQYRVSEFHSNEGDYAKRTFLPGGISSPSEEPVAEVTAHLISNETVEPQRFSNIVGDPTLKRSNLVSSFRSFVPLVHQHQPVAPYPDGKLHVDFKCFMLMLP